MKLKLTEARRANLVACGERLLQRKEKLSYSSDELRYMVRGLVQTTLPHSKPAERTIVKKNGVLGLIMTAIDPNLPLPYGIYPRLILLWLCSKIVRLKGQGNNCIEISLGANMIDFIRGIGVVTQGGAASENQRREIRHQLECLLSTAFKFTKEVVESDTTDNIVRTIAESYTLWSARGEERVEAKIKLQEWFVKDVLASPIPYDWDVIKELKRSAMDLDVFLWATWRLPKIGGYRNAPAPTFSYTSLFDQFGSGYASINEFKYRFIEALKKLELIWPSIRYEVRENGIAFYGIEQMVTTTKWNKKVKNRRRSEEITYESL